MSCPEFDINSTIEQTAANPASVSVDGMTVQSQDISKLIEAGTYLAAKKAASKNHCGLTFRTLTPGGCG
jgi:hypothetical protein